MNAVPRKKVVETPVKRAFARPHNFLEHGTHRGVCRSTPPPMCYPAAVHYGIGHQQHRQTAEARGKRHAHRRAYARRLRVCPLCPSRALCDSLWHVVSVRPLIRPLTCTRLCEVSLCVLGDVLRAFPFLGVSIITLNLIHVKGYPKTLCKLSPALEREQD